MHEAAVVACGVAAIEIRSQKELHGTAGATRVFCVEGFRV